MPISGGGGGGGITRIVTGANLTGGTIIASGTIGLQTLVASSLFGNSATVAGTLASIVLGGGLSFTSPGTINTTMGLFAGTGIEISPGPTSTVSLDSAQTASTILGNYGTVAGSARPVAIGSNLTLTPGGTLNASGGGSATTIVAGANLTGGTIIASGTIGLATLAASSLFGNFGTVAGTMAAVAIGANITLSSSGTISAAGNVVTAANTGVALNSGTIQIDNMVTLAGTNAGTTTIAPGSGTAWVVLNMPTVAGTVTVAAAPTFPGQKSMFDIKYGTTLSTPSLNSGFVMGGGITYTPGTVVNSIDRMELASPDGTHWVVLALSQGGTL